MDGFSLEQSQQLFASLKIDIDAVPLEELAAYSAVVYFLTLEDLPPDSASNLEKAHRHLRAFEHLRDIPDWHRALQVLVISPDSQVDEELHHLLGIWGYYPEQAEIYHSLLHKVNADCDTACLNGLGNFYDIIGDRTRACEYHQQHLSLAREIGDLAGEWIALVGLGNIAQTEGNFSQAANYFEKGLKIAEELKDVQGQAALLGSLGSVFVSLEKYAQARSYGKQSFDLAQKHKLLSFQGRAALVLTSVYQTLGKKTEESEAKSYRKDALAWCQQGLEVAKRISDRETIARAMQFLGDIYEEEDESIRAIGYHQQGLEIAREIGDCNIEGECLRGLGNAHNVLGNYEEAIFYFEQRLQVAEASQDNIGKRDALKGLSYGCDASGRMEEAIIWERKRVAVAKEIKDWESVASALSYLGYAYLNLEEYEAAEKSLLGALLIQEKEGDLQGQVFSFCNLATLYKDKGEKESALNACEVGLALAQETNSDLVEVFLELQELLTE